MPGGETTPIIWRMRPRMLVERGAASPHLAGVPVLSRIETRARPMPTNEPAAALSRRDLGRVLTAASAATLGFGAAEAAGLPADADQSLVAFREDPAAELRNYLRVMADLDGSVAPWWWTGHMMAVLPDENPRILFRAEGVESKQVLDIGKDGDTIVRSKVMTMFRDPDTNEILNGKTYVVPFTNETVEVKPNVIGSVTRYFSKDGKVQQTILSNETGATISGLRNNQVLANNQTDELGLTWRVCDGKVFLHGKRKYPEQRPIPLAELGTQIIDGREMADAALTRFNNSFSAVFLAPWQGFLNLAGKKQGHAVWHATGHKVKGLNVLPSDYLAEAEKYIPDVLAWKKA
jgi:hypothetical protein